MAKPNPRAESSVFQYKHFKHSAKKCPLQKPSSFQLSSVPHNVTSARVGVTASSGSKFGSSITLVFGYYLIQIFSVYYSVYHNNNAIATKRPAYLNGIYIGRIRLTLLPLILRVLSSSMENIDPKLTKLFASVSNQSALANEAPISLRIN